MIGEVVVIARGWGVEAQQRRIIAALVRRPLRGAVLTERAATDSTALEESSLLRIKANGVYVKLHDTIPAAPQQPPPPPRRRSLGGLLRSLLVAVAAPKAPAHEALQCIGGDALLPFAAMVQNDANACDKQHPEGDDDDPPRGKPLPVGHGCVRPAPKDLFDELPRR